MQQLKRRTPLKTHKPLRAYKKINRISPKQRVLNRLWNKITTRRCLEEQYICQWCHYAGHRFDPESIGYLDGHHIIKRSRGRIDTPRNCYIVHRFKCHGEIEDNNVDVRIYPDREAWLKSKEATK